MLKDKNILATPGKKINLKDYDPAYTADYKNEKEALEKMKKDIKKLTKFQDMLYAQDRYSLLIVFQAMDAAGKDGTLKHVMSGVNPQGCQVYSFKAPTPEELDHDFLWRFNKSLPERGRIGIFNRSYYEDVLVTKVHPEYLLGAKLPEVYSLDQINKEFWKARYEMINNYEKYLVQNGTVILKFFLNVSKDEQKRRFLDRINDPEKNWKFSASDVKERAFWDDYQKAFEDCISNTSTEYAPWYIIPADNKWFMRAAVCDIIQKTLKSMNLAYPEVSKEKLAELQKIKEMLEKEK